MGDEGINNAHFKGEKRNEPEEGIGAGPREKEFPLVKVSRREPNIPA